MKLLDNKAHGTVVDALRAALSRAESASVLTDAWSVFAWQALQRELQQLDSLRVLLTQPTQPSASVTPELLAQSLLGGPEERPLRNSLSAPTIARACAAWLASNVQFKTTAAAVPHSLYHVTRRGSDPIAIQGSASFTAPGLGLVPSSRFELATAYEGEFATSFLTLFDSLWGSGHLARDARADLLAALSRIADPRSPQLVYLATLFNLFRDTLDDLDEERIVRTRTGIRDTLVWKKLYRFQRDGVLGVIDKLERHGGCILADSVGLGKTFEALAVIKYYELRNDRVLVLAPKKLRENWTVYTTNDKRNLFAADRFNYDVLNHTDLSRKSGRSGEINLETLNWGNYDLVVIDESHNFRNNPQRKTNVTRYARLMRDIIKAGVKTRVLMLSATPVNSRMNDLKNQVAFITEGRDDALASHGIQSIEATLRRAQARFNQWLDRTPEDRTTRSLLEALDFDYFKLLDLLTIARSRKHIAKYYDVAEIGKFPVRNKPINVKADIDTAGLFPRIVDVNRDIRRLTLAAYAPLRYVLPAKREAYNRKYDMQIDGGRAFRQLDREESLVHLMRVNLLKRMESSISSFTTTVDNLLGKVDGLLARLSNHTVTEIDELDIEDIDLDNEDLESQLVGNRVRVLLDDVDRIRWRQDLEADRDILLALAREGRTVEPARDAKLARLRELITAKVRAPVNTDNRKVMVFTAFADTADYLYANLAAWAQSELGVYTAIVTGGSNGNKTNLSGLRADLHSILTSFSPRSKERDKVDTAPTGDLDLLIATDCISEGQNLQDCDYLINYDIHWNPVRIIQRFGRIDRLGSKNEVIQLVNFWPNMELDEYINLEARVSGRMVLLDISATGEENVIEATANDQMNDLEYRRRQFQQLYEEVIDIEDLSSGISITDLTLQDLRMDLVRSLPEHRALFEQLPLGAYGVTSRDATDDPQDLPAGVFFCLRNERPKSASDKTYPFAPHYVVQVDEQGEVRLDPTHTRQVLQRMKRLALGRSQVDPRAREHFDQLTRSGRDLDGLRAKLSRAVAAITGKIEEQGVASLFQRGGTQVDKHGQRGIDDFEVIAMLVVLGSDSP